MIPSHKKAVNSFIRGLSFLSFLGSFAITFCILVGLFDMTSKPAVYIISSIVGLITAGAYVALFMYVVGLERIVADQIHPVYDDKFKQAVIYYCDKEEIIAIMKMQFVKSFTRNDWTKARNAITKCVNAGGKQADAMQALITEVKDKLLSGSVEDSSGYKEMDFEVNKSHNEKE